MSVAHFSSVIAAVAAGSLPDVVLSNRNLTDSVTHPSNATADLQFATDGQFTVVQGGSSQNIPGQWAVTPGAGTGDLFEIRFRQIAQSGGAFTGDVFNTWLPLSSARAKGFSLSGAGVATATIAADIGELGQNTALTTAQFNITLNKDALVAANWQTLIQQEGSTSPQTAAIDFFNTGITTPSGTWATPTTGVIGGNYEIRGELLSGSTPQGPTLGANTWHNLGTSRRWSVTRLSIGVTQATVRFSIRRAGTTTVLATRDTQLEAQITDV